ncbi:MAG: hypothetical protein Q8L14_05780 [Myxococcales bacterium]|nr:hypothetical protein [Myxococcales bacterium]
MAKSNRFTVFSIRESKTREGKVSSVWVRAGTAWLNRDLSINVFLDVLPLDGKLHIREALEKDSDVTPPATHDEVTR